MHGIGRQCPFKHCAVIVYLSLIICLSFQVTHQNEIMMGHHLSVSCTVRNKILSFDRNSRKVENLHQNMDQFIVYSLKIVLIRAGAWRFGLQWWTRLQVLENEILDPSLSGPWSRGLGHWRPDPLVDQWRWRCSRVGHTRGHPLWPLLPPCHIWLLDSWYCIAWPSWCTVYSAVHGITYRLYQDHHFSATSVDPTLHNNCQEVAHRVDCFTFSLT